MWNWTTRDKKGGDTNGTNRLGPSQLSRFEPVHKREDHAPRRPRRAAPQRDGLKAQDPAAPPTPLNQMMYADQTPEVPGHAEAGSIPVADCAPAPTGAVASSEPAPHATADQSQSTYLTGLEEEPPIPVDILRRALAGRLKPE